MPFVLSDHRPPSHRGVELSRRDGKGYSTAPLRDGKGYSTALEASVLGSIVARQAPC